MGIKIKNRDPKSTDFGKNDIIINNQDGTLFFKTSNNNLFKVQGDNLNTLVTESSTLTIPDGTISSSAQLPNGIISSSEHIFTAITSSGEISASGTLFADGIHLRSSNVPGPLPGPIIQLETSSSANFTGGGGGDSFRANTFIRFGDSSEDYSYALGIDDHRNSFKLAYNSSSFSGSILGDYTGPSDDIITIIGTTGVDGAVKGNIGLGTRNPRSPLEILRSGSNSEISIVRGDLGINNHKVETRLRLKAQDTKTRIVYESGSLIIDRNNSGTNTLTL